MTHLYKIFKYRSKKYATVLAVVKVGFAMWGNPQILCRCIAILFGCCCGTKKPVIYLLDILMVLFWPYTDLMTILC